MEKAKRGRYSASGRSQGRRRWVLFIDGGVFFGVCVCVRGRDLSIVRVLDFVFFKKFSNL